MRVGKQCGSALLGWEKARAAGTLPSPEERAHSSGQELRRNEQFFTLRAGQREQLCQAENILGSIRANY